MVGVTNGIYRNRCILRVNAIGTQPTGQDYCIRWKFHDVACILVDNTYNTLFNIPHQGVEY